MTKKVTTSMPPVPTDLVGLVDGCSSAGYRAAKAANAVPLEVEIDPETMSLYGTRTAVLNEEATLQSVRWLVYGNAYAVLDEEQRDIALKVIRQRFSDYERRISQ